MHLCTVDFQIDNLDCILSILTFHVNFVFLPTMTVREGMVSEEYVCVFGNKIIVKCLDAQPSVVACILTLILAMPH